MSFHVPNDCRFYKPGNPMSSTPAFGNNGAFILMLTDNLQLVCIASDGSGWDHVSVTARLQNGKQRCPYWSEMCKVKDMFWDPGDCVIQYHPPEDEYVSMHDYCLHLWRPQGVDLPRPDPIMVGIKKPRS